MVLESDFGSGAAGSLASNVILGSDFGSGAAGSLATDVVLESDLAFSSEGGMEPLDEVFPNEDGSSRDDTGFGFSSEGRVDFSSDKDGFGGNRVGFRSGNAGFGGSGFSSEGRVVFCDNDGLGGSRTV